MYILLSGKPPFYGKNDKEIIGRVKKGKFKFQGKEWKQVSKSAKKLIENMLQIDPSSRPTAGECLEHEWF